MYTAICFHNYDHVLHRSIFTFYERLYCNTNFGRHVSVEKYDICLHWVHCNCTRCGSNNVFKIQVIIILNYLQIAINSIRNQNVFCCFRLKKTQRQRSLRCHGENQADLSGEYKINKKIL